MSYETIKRVETDTQVLKIYRDYDSNDNPREWDNLGTMVYSHRNYILGDERAQNTDLYNSWEEWLHREVLDEYGEDNVVYLPLYLYDHSGITMNTTGFYCPWDSGQVGWIYATKDTFRKETGYMEDELFSTDKHRPVKVRNIVKVKGLEDKDFGRIIEIDGDKVTVDFDFRKSPNFKKEENVIETTLDNIAEVLSNRAVEMLKGEVELFDQYLRGDVYYFTIEKKYRCASSGEIEYELDDSVGGFFGTDWENNGLFDHIPEEFKEHLI